MDKFHDQDRIWFGKHNGATLEDVPAHYLIWLWNDGFKRLCCDTGKRGKLALYIDDARGALEMDCPDKIMDKREDPEEE